MDVAFDPKTFTHFTVPEGEIYLRKSSRSYDSEAIYESFVCLRFQNRMIVHSRVSEWSYTGLEWHASTTWTHELRAMLEGAAIIEPETHRLPGNRGALNPDTRSQFYEWLGATVLPDLIVRVDSSHLQQRIEALQTQITTHVLELSRLRQQQQEMARRAQENHQEA